MLNHIKTRVTDSFEAPVVAGSNIVTEGQALVKTFVNGVAHVAPSTGVAGESFIGFSYGETVIPNTAPAVHHVPVALATVTLPNAPVGGTQLRVTSNGVALTSAGAAPTPVAGSYVITGNVITLNAAEVGTVVDVTYRYALTAQQAQMLYGDGVIGQSAAALLNSTGVITCGTVYTDQYDVTADFSAAGIIRLGANGVMTNVAGTGIALTGIVTVVELPTAENPMLGFRMNAI